MGANLFFASTGAVLEVIGVPIDDALIDGWRERIARAAAHLGWRACAAVARRHAGGASLAISAPLDQLFLATEVNEWALCATLVRHDPPRFCTLEQALVTEAREAAETSPSPAADIAPVIEESRAFERFSSIAAMEARPALCALLAAAAARHLPHVLDESVLTLGAGAGGQDFPLAALPEPGTVTWAKLHDVPTAIITGSNGKTTTVRVLAACARAHGLRASFNCTDGVFFGDQALASGDYSGPAGARKVLREHRTQAAMLETARGGILRRGLAISQANVAVVTNISSDHFGEYGIDDLAGLADTKLTVAAVLPAGGLLVLNADDALLRSRAGLLAARFGRCPPLGWFAASADGNVLREYRARGEPTCGVRAGRLYLERGGAAHDLGDIATMPLSLNGVAAYNVANLAAAALAAAALGIPPAAIAGVLGSFGANIQDNPGRLMRFFVAGVTVLIDYAHNPDGLRGLLTVAEHLRGGNGRLGLILGHAGNRLDSDLEQLARVAAEFRPALVVVKETEKHLRGREPGEIPRILLAELRRTGLPESALPPPANSELEAAQAALAWARDGDVLALPVHSSQARAAVVAMLQSR